MKSLLRSVIIILSLAALITQGYINFTLTPVSESWIEAIFRFLSHFTLLSNMMVLLILLIPAVSPRSTLAKWCESPRITGAAALYMFMSATIYALILGDLWSSAYIARITESVLHYLLPALYLSYWAIFRSSQINNWMAPFLWLIAPILYISFILIRGNLVQWYPYPFLDVELIGIATVLYNSAGMGFLFWLAGVALTAADQRL